MRKILLAVWAVLFLSVSAVHAHHLWVMEENGQWVVARGHMPDSLDPYDPACVREIRAFDADGKPLAVQRKDEKDRVVFQPSQPTDVMTVRCDWGVRVNTTRGKKLISRKIAEEQGLTVIDSFFSTQFFKRIFAGSGRSIMPAGLKLDIIPLKLPAELKPGEALPVKVVYDEKPLADVRVASTADEQPVKTDSDGVAMIRIPENGRGLIWTKWKSKESDHPGVDYQVYTTFLMIEGK